MFRVKSIPYKKVLEILPVIFLCFLLVGIAFLDQRDEKRFQKLTVSLFQESLSEDTLSLHYTLAYPENFGVNDRAILPVYNAKISTESDYDEISHLLSRLSDISPEKLNNQDAYTYKLLYRYLEKKLEGTRFPYYSEPLSPSSGMQAGLPILLADYTFRNSKDVETYLALLDQTDDYFRGLTTYEMQKADTGLFMPPQSAAKVIKQCDTIMNSDLLTEKKHFLNVSFQERVDSLVSKNLITEEKAKQYVAENDRLLTTVMEPAYEQTADALTLLEDKGTRMRGLGNFPNGRAYYAYLLSSSTASNRSVEEIKKMLFQDFQQNYTALVSLLSKHPELIYADETISLSSENVAPSEIIQNLQKQMSSEFPAFPQTTERFSPACTIKYVSSSMEDYCSPAYYLTPPIDDMENNIIYINTKNEPDFLTLYTTLAHEGYPGHLYQTVYSQLYQNHMQDNPVRSILHYGGFVEGWALYVENLSYSYAGKQMQSKSQNVSDYCECCRLNRNLHLCLYSLLDIAIHYENATPIQVAKILQTVGVTDLSARDQIYEYIVEEPTNYPKYYVGYLEFNLLKEKAKVLWQQDYSDYLFHKFVLDTGPSDFTSLGEKLSKTSILYSSSSIPSK